MVLRVKPTPTRFPTNSLYTPVDNTNLHSISSVCHPWGWRSGRRWRAHNEGSVPMIVGCFAIVYPSINLQWVDAYSVDEEPR